MREGGGGVGGEREREREREREKERERERERERVKEITREVGAVPNMQADRRLFVLNWMSLVLKSMAKQVPLANSHNYISLTDAYYTCQTKNTRYSSSAGTGPMCFEF